MSMNSPDYLTYKKSKQKLDRAGGKASRLKIISWIFIITFSLCFALFTNFAAKYTTKMDIEYDKNSTTAQGQSYIDNAFGTDSLIGSREADENGHVIDSRLKLIQLEETAPYEARVVNKDKNAVIDREHYDRITSGDDIFAQEKKSEPKARQDWNSPAQNSASTSAAPQPELAPQTFIKVLAGKYKTFDDAKMAQLNLRNAGQTGTPFIRKIGEIYTLQIGSYSNPDVAKTIAQSYSDLGYEVWILHN